MTEKFNRRNFIKYSLLLSTNVFVFLNKRTSKYALLGKESINNSKMGRVLFGNTQSHKLPSSDSDIVDTYSFNDIVDYQNEITVRTGQHKDEIWCRLLEGGYINYQYIQPVKNILNDPAAEISASGKLAEVTVPYTTAVVNQKNNNRNDTQDQMFFYGSTHWIYGLGKDEKGNLYYLIKEDRWENSYYVNATHMRLVKDEELTPISSEVEVSRKIIRINLQDQYLVAYEDEQPVFMSALSSGHLSGDTDLTTPTGNFQINYKRPSRHMVHSDRIGINDNELYGVPWVSYFTDSGIALHGTYWHNDFSQPNSHGCINLPIPAARWLYLWTYPIVPPREKKYVSNRGTRIEVF